MAGLNDLLTPADNRIPGATFTFQDADTVLLDEPVGDVKGVRLRGVLAPETGLKTGEVGGTMTTQQVIDLANKMGYTNLTYDENERDDTGTRFVGDLQDKHGRSFARALATSGILGVSDQHDTENLRESAEYGAYLRTASDYEANDWDKAKAAIDEAMLEDQKYANQFKTQQLIAGDARYSELYDDASAAFEYRDRDTGTGKSLSPFSDAWDTGIIGVQESMWGVLDLLGETNQWDGVANIGKAGVERARSRIADRGHFITDYKDVDGFWDAIEYVGNNAALSLPYMGITVAGTVAAPFTGGLSLTAPAAVYAGQTWNEMEGEKNAAVAIGAGVAQAALDRLGIGLVFKGVGKAPRDLLKAGVEKLVADGMTREAAQKTVMAATRKELAHFAGDAAKVAADQLKAKALFKSVASRLTTGAAGESATEALQETVAYAGATLGSDKDWDWNELNERQIQALVAGGTLGGAFSVPSAAYDAGAWADVAVRQAPADAKRLSLAGKFADEEKREHGRISSIQENNANTRARSVQAGPNAHPSLEERSATHKQSKKDRTFMDSVIDTLHSAPALWQGATRYIFQPDILEKSRSARIMADMFGGQLQRTFHGSNYENTKHHIASIYRNMVPNPSTFWKARGIRDLTGLVSRKRIAEENVKMYAAINAAIDPDTKEINMDAIPEDMKPLVADLLKLGDKMWSDQSKFNPELGYQKNYLLRYKSFDKKAIYKNKQEFASLLKKHFGFSEADAIELANRITESGEVNDFADILDGAAAAGRPGHHKERTLNLSERAEFQQFMEQDLFTNVANAAKSAARFQAYQEFVGDNHSQINQLLSDMQAEGVPPEQVNKIAAQMTDYLAAESGNYKRATSPMGKRLESIQRSLMKWMTVAGLPLATISSFVELALTTKGLTKSEIMGPIRTQGEEIGKTMWDKFGEIAEYDKKLEGEEPAAIKGKNVLDKLGYLTWDVGSASTTSTANKVGATEVSDIDNKFMEFYFRSIGLTQWTNYTRSIRAAFAGDFLKSKLELIANSDPNNKTNAVQEAEEHLRNYGLDVDTAVQNYLEGQPIDEAQLREFQFNWINDAVVLPQAANRPLIYQDPRFALFTQFQGFISAFTANQIPRMWGDYVKRGTPAMKYNAFATMATMIMLGFASQYLKDLLKYGEYRKFGPDDHPYLNTSEYLQRGVRASGLLGTGERVLDQFFPIYEQRSDNAGEWLFNTTTGESPSLGFAKRMIGGIGAGVEGDVGKAAKELTRTVPYVGPINWLRDAAGEAGSAWNFKGD